MINGAKTGPHEAFHGGPDDRVGSSLVRLVPTPFLLVLLSGPGPTSILCAPNPSAQPISPSPASGPPLPPEPTRTPLLPSLLNTPSVYAATTLQLALQTKGSGLD